MDTMGGLTTIPGQKISLSSLMRNWRTKILHSMHRPIKQNFFIKLILNVNTLVGCSSFFLQDCNLVMGRL